MEPKQRVKAWLDGIGSAVLVAASFVILYNRLRIDSTKDEASPEETNSYRAENIESRQLTTRLSREDYSPGELIAIEFGDFECRYCRLFANELLPLLRDKAKFVFRHFPLTDRKTAVRAATAALCAEKQGKFWQAHNILFAEPAMMNSDTSEFADKIGLDADLFTRCLSSAANDYQLDQREGTRLGVSSTPQFFFGRVDRDGVVTLTRRIVGARPISVFEDTIAGFGNLSAVSRRWIFDFSRRSAAWIGHSQPRIDGTDTKQREHIDSHILSTRPTE